MTFVTFFGKIPAPCSKRSMKMKKMPMKKSRKQTTLKEEAGRMLLDISRMVFAGIVIVEILRWQSEGLMRIYCMVYFLLMVKREIKTEKSPSYKDGGAKRRLSTLTSTLINKGWRRKRGKR